MAGSRKKYVIKKKSNDERKDGRMERVKTLIRGAKSNDSIARPIVSIAIGLIISIVIFAIAGVYLYNAYFSPVDRKGEEKVVVIESGSSLSAIANILEEEGIIRSSSVFKYYVDFSNMASKLRAGTYKLSTDMTYDDIIDTLKKSNNKNVTSKITFTEGSSIQDYAALLVKKGIFNNELTFLSEVQSASEYSGNVYISEILDDADAVKNRKYLLEGYLYPETYEIYSSASPSQIIQNMLDEFSKKFTDEMAERAAELNMSVDDVVILASMIEREAKTDDFTKVSAVFHNRLNNGMNLESCATHQYFMGERATEDFRRPVP